MFGAELFVPSAIGGSLQDTGPTPMPILDNIEAVDELEVPDMTAGLMPDVEQIVRTWRALAPEWVDIVTPFPIGPFTLGSELRGSGLFTDMLDDPVRCHRLLDLCARTQIRTEYHLREVIGGPRRLPISNFGVRSEGRRLGDDVILNLSPEMITKFAVPPTETISRALGPATVHICTLPGHRADHVFEPLAAAPLIPVASSQFAFEYYETHLEQLRGRLALEAFYGDAYEYVCEKFGSFKDWAFDFVRRFKSESGLVLYTWVSSLELGQEMWETWHEAHNR